MLIVYTQGMIRKHKIPKSSASCLCGSGKKLRECCKSRLPGFAKKSAWREAAREDKWAKALLYLRADITQYTIWHNTNTSPMIGKIPVDEFKFLEIDINALNSYIPDLARCYINLGRIEEFPAVLERLRSNINDIRWQRKIIYHQCLGLLFDSDRDGARREFAKLGSIGSDETDIEILQLYVDLEGEYLGFTKKTTLCDQILTLSDARSDLLQYSGIKAFEMLLVSDVASAKIAFLAVIEKARESETENQFNPLERVLFCRLLEGLAVINDDKAMFQEIVRRLTEDLQKPEWTPSGRAQLYRSIGDANRHSGQLEEAITAYKAGRNLEDNEIQDVFRAECLVRQRRNDEAIAVLNGLNTEGFDEAEKADFAFCFACAAVVSGSGFNLEKAESLLKDCKPVSAYFDQMRLRHLVNVKDTKDNKKMESPTKRRKSISRLMSAVSRYFLLQPNAFGMGVNFNAIIDDYAEPESDEAP